MTRDSIEKIGAHIPEKAGAAPVPATKLPRGMRKHSPGCARCGHRVGEHHWEGELLCSTHYAEKIGQQGYEKWKKRKEIMKSVCDQMGITNIRKIPKAKQDRFRMLVMQAGYEGVPRQRWGTLTGKKHGEGVHYGDEKKRTLPEIRRGTRNLPSDPGALEPYWIVPRET